MRRYLVGALAVAVLAAAAIAIWTVSVHRGGKSHPVLAAATRSGQPALFPSTPDLRIEVSQHSAAINAVAEDKAGHYLVTGSDDKTVRVWEPPNASHNDLRQVAVLHPPTAEGVVGRIYAVAMSPDGSLIAVGGWMTPQSATERFYIFDRATARLVKVVSAPFGAPHRLTFSPDGIYLAISLDDGVHQYRTSDWRQIARDTKFRDTTYGLAYTAKNRLVVASTDGMIRVYNEGASVPSETAQLENRIIPWEVAVSPDGTKIAVGHGESLAITMFAASGSRLLDNRRDLIVPDTGPGDGQEHDDFNLCHVTFSADGRYLFAAGGYRRAGDANGLVRWDLTAPTGPVFGVRPTSSHNAIFGVVPFGPSGAAIVSADPLTEGYDAVGKTVFSQTTTLRDLRIFLSGKDEPEFRVSNNGDVIDLPRKAYHSGLRVDLNKGSVVPIAAPDQNLVPPMVQTGGFTISNWANRDDPEFKSRTFPQPIILQMEPHDLAESLAISPNGGWFVLGSSWMISLYDMAGRLMDTVPLPAPTWRVDVTPNRHMVVAAGGDGIVRWFAVRLMPGPRLHLEQVLSLYVNEPDHRWVAWTPNGFYAASVGGEDLIGWHINRGENRAALFYGASRFRDLYYRPDLIRKVLKTGALPQAPDANRLLARLPPIVHVLGVEPGDDGKAVVKYIVESPNNEPLIDVSVMVDGARMNPPGSRAISENDVVQTATINLPSGTTPRELKISAATKRAGYGDARGVPIAPNLLPQAGALKGRLFALVVGVAKYQDRSIPTALYSDLDANAVAAALRAQKGVRYKDVQVIVLTNQKATREAVEEALQDMRVKPTGDDVSLLFFSGHGYKWQDPSNGKQTPDYYFVTSDAHYSQQKIASTALPYEMLEGYVTKALGKKLIFLDTCYSGRVGDNDDTAGLTNLLSRSEGGAMVWSSSTGSQESYPVPSLKHGAFTAALLQALAGKADSYVYTQPDRSITQHALTFWLDNMVPRLSANHQNPTESDVGLSSQAFPILSAVKL
jgi:WD40 repeat protein